MSGRPWESAAARISSVKGRCSPPDLRIRFLPTRRSVRCTWVRISNCRLGAERNMLKPSLQLRIGQQLTMTPQLQQAIRLLQLPSLDLQAHVRETLETNVMLEAEEETLETSVEIARDAVRGLARARSTRAGGKVRRARRQQHRRRSARRAGGGDRRRGLGRTGQRPVGYPLVGRRRPQQRFQRPARPDPAGTAHRAVANSPNCPPSTWRSRASSPTPSPTTGTSRIRSKTSA